MKIVTFNIRCDYGQDGNNNFCFRKPLILEKLSREAADIICFQEALPHMAAWLREALQEYYVIGCGRSQLLESILSQFWKHNPNHLAVISWGQSQIRSENRLFNLLDHF